ncbi:MAG: hypothetical protein ABW128_03540 [Rhizorhabdus sp.]
MLLFGCSATAGMLVAPTFLDGAVAQRATPQLPPPPPGGVMGFVVDRFAPAVPPGDGACPSGPVPRVRDAYLLTLPLEERARLSQKSNEPELTKRWQEWTLGPGGTNICSQPDRFDRPAIPTVRSNRALGLDLDNGGATPSCVHASFTSPTGEKGIDNQAYRAMGCTPEWLTLGEGSEVASGYRQFLASGEWTQVLLLQGVDSLERDDQVEVIYGNTPDRPLVDSEGQYLAGASFTISNKAPRHRNVLRGRIVAGVLTTEPAAIKLTQTWGQGGVKDIRGHRTAWTLKHAQLRLTFQPDGGLRGLVGGYQPMFELVQAPSIGGVGSATVAGIDCAAQLKTLTALADGTPDPKTGQCTTISTALDLRAVPAFVNDVSS